MDSESLLILAYQLLYYNYAFKVADSGLLEIIVSFRPHPSEYSSPGALSDCSLCVCVCVCV